MAECIPYNNFFKNIIIYVFLLLSSCSPSEFVINGTTMGTTYQIKSNIFIDKKVIDKKLKKLNSIFSTWDKNSQISKINQNKERKFIKVSDELFFLLKESQILFKKTNGYFDGGIGRLIDIWGFALKKIKKPPTPQKIQYALDNSSIKHLEFKNNQIKKLKDIYLNLSAIAKGFAIDEIIKILKQTGVKSGLVEIGGEIRVIGTKNIGIENFDKIPLKVILTNQAIATSGNYRNYQILDNQKFIHIINPKTGYPSQSDLISVSVISSTTYLADAYATALLVMGKERAIKFIQNYQLKSVLIDKNNKIYKFLTL